MTAHRLQCGQVQQPDDPAVKRPGFEVPQARWQGRRRRRRPRRLRCCCRCTRPPCPQLSRRSPAQRALHQGPSGLNAEGVLTPRHWPRQRLAAAGAAAGRHRAAALRSIHLHRHHVCCCCCCCWPLRRQLLGTKVGRGPSVAGVRLGRGAEQEGRGGRARAPRPRATAPHQQPGAQRGRRRLLRWIVTLRAAPGSPRRCMQPAQ